MDEDKEKMDVICDKLAILYSNLEEEIKILKNILENCQNNNNVCPYCLRNLLENDHSDDCAITLMINKYDQK